MRISFISALTATTLLLCSSIFAAEDNSSVVSKEWRNYIEPLAPIAQRLSPKLTDPEDPQLRQELYRSLFSQIAMGYIGLTYADKEHPDFWPYFTNAFNWLGPNPDNNYYVTPVDEDGIYKITGYRGTVKRVVIQLGNGAFVPRGVLDEHYLGDTLANYDFDDLTRNDDDYLEVIVSKTRPKGYQGDWWKMPDTSSYLFMRQISYDWVNEVDGRFAIERLDTPAAKPRPSAAQLEENMSQIAHWTESLVDVSAGFIDSVRKQGFINKLTYKSLADAGGIVTQKYVYGLFDLAPGEALLIEAPVPKECRYWSIHLTDDLFFTLDWMNRQTSVNGYTAKIDDDGVFRVVISAQDPGVPNWLDNMGYQTGAIQARWEMCSSWPEHTVTKVKTSDVRTLLPENTPVISAAQRDTSIRERRRGAQMRKRW